MSRVLLACGAVGALVTVGAIYRVSPYARSVKSLRVVVVSERADERVTGYRAVIENVGFLPVVVGRCETVSDAMQPDTVVGDDIQQWQQNGHWKTMLPRHECRVAVMGTIEARFTSKFLWPHQTVL